MGQHIDFQVGQRQLLQHFLRAVMAGVIDDDDAVAAPALLADRLEATFEQVLAFIGKDHREYLFHRVRSAIIKGMLSMATERRNTLR